MTRKWWLVATSTRREPQLIVERRGQSLGVAQMPDDRLDLSQREERVAQAEPKIDRLLARRARLGKMRQRRQRLLEVGRRLTVCRPVERARAGLGKIPHGLFPDLAADRVIGEPLHLLGKTLGIERFDDLDDPRVQRLLPLVQQAAVGDLVGQPVLERVLDVGEEAGLIQELGRLQVRESSLRAISSGCSAIASSSENGTSTPITAAACSRRFSSGGSRSMRAARMAWTVAGTWMPASGLARR